VTPQDSLCLIPAKGASTRLPGKNLLPLGGHPLVAHSIRKAAVAGAFGTICVSTEDPELAEVAKSYGADVPFLRPDHLSRDPATIVDVALHALDHYLSAGRSFERVCILLPTTPFILLRDISEALALFAASQAEALMSVTPAEFPPFNAWLIEGTGNGSRMQACFPNSPYKHVKSTECPTAYRSNGAIAVADVAALREYKTYYHSAPVPFVMPQERSTDIDIHHEYRIAQLLWDNGVVETDEGLFR
jgi:CMP-N-acetylneuraminic acid synthetase